ncbi:type I restriction endonuclease [Actinomyces sp. HMSC065F12]|uniref:type I restriction endonuclease n=1 Tax=Actinomyces sp. HMSC065F12 TaxID=1739479 RepID=UPI0008A20D94|nr:type I restriction endonuclease [Actinomyces sp. HMSC065F12]OFP72988.1 restriction endonuclease [Actinomyces sp. HMSC065F12]
MDFGDALTALSDKVNKQWESIETEEGTKNAFIMPFISTVLGYDVFDPTEVIPEFTADVGVKKGEKIDYAIRNSGDVQILIECKKCSGALTLEHASQLYRYFAVTTARIAVLTNGRVYNFYTDLDSPNKMDSRPFLVLDLADLDETVLPELKKLTKANFDLTSVMDAAEELKYLGAIRRAVAAEFKEVSEEFARYFIAKVYEGRITQSVVEKFKPLVDKALRQFLSERVNDRLKTALGASETPVITPTAPLPEPAVIDSAEEGEPVENSEIVTTEEELAAYRVVKAIACAELSPDRITYRDQKTYFSVLADNNNRRPIVRCYFNSKARKNLVFVAEDRSLTKYELGTIEDIYLYVDQIREAAKRYQ